jgi:REP element-mobilizing transposase RayT
MTQIKYYGVDTGIPISEKHVLRVKENNGQIVKLIKQQTTYYLWQKYPNFLSKQYWKKKIFWSGGYFVCSIGEVSSATIQKYIESQG